MQEIWKSLKGIVEYGDYYEVSNLGRVRSVDRRVNSRNGKRLVKGQILKQQVDKYGYMRVYCYLNGKGRNYQVHRLVALSFIPNLENKPQVNHKDGNKQNNHIDNLEWSTNKENMKHAFSIGLNEGIKGEENVNAKLTENDVVNIYNLYKTNKYSMKDLADKFNTSETNVFNIVSRNSWKHLDIGEPIIRDTSESLLSRDDNLVKNIISMYKNRLSLRKISENTGVSRTTVKDILKSNGFKIEPNYIKLSDEDKCKIKELYETGLYNKTELANMFNVSRPTIRKIVAKD
jgi:predicted DNA-binding protein YlxM (UPF0122 family)